MAGWPVHGTGAALAVAVDISRDRAPGPGEEDLIVALPKFGGTQIIGTQDNQSNSEFQTVAPETRKGIEHLQSKHLT